VTETASQVSVEVHDLVQRAEQSGYERGRVEIGQQVGPAVVEMTNRLVSDLLVSLASRIQAYSPETATLYRDMADNISSLKVPLPEPEPVQEAEVDLEVEPAEAEPEAEPKKATRRGRKS
jgi:hypothetical protein